MAVPVAAAVFGGLVIWEWMLQNSCYQADCHWTVSSTTHASLLTEEQLCQRVWRLDGEKADQSLAMINRTVLSYTSRDGAWCKPGSAVLGDCSIQMDIKIWRLGGPEDFKEWTDTLNFTKYGSMEADSTVSCYKKEPALCKFKFTAV